MNRRRSKRTSSAANQARVGRTAGDGRRHAPEGRTRAPSRNLDAALVALLSSLAFAFSVTPALAAEGGETNNVFAGDIGNALWTLIIFVIVLLVLGKYAWGPLLKSVQARESYIRESLEHARRDRDSAEARLRDYEEKLAAARAEATAIIEEGRRDAEVVRRRIEEHAKQESARMIERARRDIELATESAKRELYHLSARLAIDIAARVVGRELTPQDHERLIAESIAAMPH
ncbi:MAG TPA: F0F1 ATP synthase subunit B [Thermoanaerobaculia bacterium]|nr:F0F1 ATP synthase subunit B [Thermoanaerobaculia bacterium]